MLYPPSSDLAMLKQKSSLSAYRNYCHYLSHKHFFWRLEADVMWCCIEAVCGSKGLRTIAMIETSIKRDGVVRTERRCYISSRLLTAQAFATAARAHWAIKNGLHWVLDLTVQEDQSRLRRGHGAQDMTLARHLALNVIRSMQGETSIKSKPRSRENESSLPGIQITSQTQSVSIHVNRTRYPVFAPPLLHNCWR
jgi:predicted transposase YbfD/YdcC